MVGTPQMVLKCSVTSMVTVAQLVSPYRNRYVRYEAATLKLSYLLFLLQIKINGLKDIEVSSESYWSLSDLYGQVCSHIKHYYYDTKLYLCFTRLLIVYVCHQQSSIKDAPNY